MAYLNLGNVLSTSEHNAEAAQRFLEAKERYPMGSDLWAKATAEAIDLLRQFDETAKPEWWNDEELKALSARVVRAAPNNAAANSMRATVLSGLRGGPAWGLQEPRSAAEIKEAVTYFERVAAIHPAPAVKAHYASIATSLLISCAASGM